VLLAAEESIIIMRPKRTFVAPGKQVHVLFIHHDAHRQLKADLKLCWCVSLTPARVCIHWIAWLEIDIGCHCNSQGKI